MTAHARGVTDKLPLLVLLGSALLVAAVTFAISAHGLFGFGRHVMGLPDGLALLIPVMLDGAQLVAIAAAFLTRAARLRVRVYMWSVSALTVVASMAGNAWDARVRGLSDAGVVATMAAPALLALMAHVIVITWRHREHVTASASKTTPAATIQPQTSQQTSRKPRPRREPLRVVNGSRVDAADVRALAAQGLTRAQIAERLGVSPRTVYRHLSDATDRPEPVGVTS